MKAKFVKNLRVLHVGCGSGLLTTKLAQNGIGPVVGIDPHEACISAAQSSLEKIQLDMEKNGKWNMKGVKFRNVSIDQIIEEVKNSNRPK